MKLLANFSDFKIWSSMFQFGFVCLMLLLGNTIRRKVPFIQKSLLPTAVIGGFIGLIIKEIVKNIGIQIDGQDILTNDFFEMITYHTIAVGFIAMGLVAVKKYEKRPEGFKSGLLIVSTYLMQGIVGMAITMVLFLGLKDVAPFSGLLLPMGFGQGPGQANNIGYMFETTGLFPGGQTFGLSVSTLGFVWACIPGVWYLNYLQKKNQLKRVYEDSVTEGSTTIVEGTGEIPLVESVDKLTIQVAFVFLSYLLTFLIMFGVTELIKKSNNKFLIDNVVPLIWGFNFLFGIFTTMLVKRVLILLRKKKIMKRVYTNDYMLNRIAGVAFDIMIISSIIAIDVKMLSSWQLILALVIISTVGGVLTLLYIRFATKKLYPQYQHEGMVSMYGMLTGTASTGIALLREIDPKFETPAAENLVTGSGSAALLGAPLLLIISVAKTSNYLYLFIALGLMTVFFVLYNFLMFGIKRKA